MSKISKFVMFCAVFVCLACFMADSEVFAEEMEDPIITVEAVVVEVQLDALYDSPAGSLSENSAPVSLTEILACLLDGTGTIKGQSKVATVSGESANATSQEKQFIPIEKLVRNQDSEYNIVEYHWTIKSIQFNVIAHSDNNKEIKLEYSFNYQAPESNLNFEKSVVSETSYDWQNIVTLEVNKPAIVASTQLTNKVAFKILCSKIQNEQGWKIIAD